MVKKDLKACFYTNHVMQTTLLSYLFTKWKSFRRNFLVLMTIDAIKTDIYMVYMRVCRNWKNKKLLKKKEKKLQKSFLENRKGERRLN